MKTFIQFVAPPVPVEGEEQPEPVEAPEEKCFITVKNYRDPAVLAA